MIKVGDIVQHFKRELLENTDNTLYLYKILEFLYKNDANVF